uniref:Peptide alpha-N-acetyltransferase n=1 Tax=Kwoniella bestiolae CBS 10118 TaxID=1296100 RepID=A0A1B9FXL6_9TREE|nr:peptide alpha-N-acetyltransferase [Kwoniella bestiolae CBS 10118]OCF23507.1 peptide alpha-N-acetyltransferase [Kwoniella bestiolae CBS 10118]
MAHSAPKHRQLPDKESKLFRELLTQYELKQYKKGIKAADTILKKFPNHGETLALKALTLHSSLPEPLTVSAVPKKEEAENMARLAIKKDITSHITWHVLGILAKSRKDWDEASRAFAMARKQDPDNIPLIRDSIALLTHTRQYPAALAARHHYLLLRPQIRSSWLALVIAHQLNGDLDEALKVFEDYQTTLKEEGATGPEKSQILLHILRIYIEAGKDQEGLEKLRQGVRDGVISPRGESMIAQMLANLGRQEDALQTYQELLEQNSDNLEYYKGYLQKKGIDAELTDDSRSKILDTLSSFAEIFPRSAAPRRLALDYSTGDKFRELARAYIVKGLERGVPSLFVDVKGVYTDAEKMKIVGEIVEEIVGKLEKDASLSNDDSISPPTMLLWAYYYLSLHLSYPLQTSPNYPRSLDLLNKAIEHTPTLPELYMAKAMVLKRSGDLLNAAYEMEKARLLDGQDRFLNGKSAKYWLRAGEIKKAEELLAVFTKKDLSPVQDLTDLQCLWFLQEEGDAYRKEGNLAMALKRYQALATVFQDYEDDQYDFHTYCMRRMTFGAYVSLMRYEDQLRSHPGYFNGALAAIEIYTQVFDDPSITEENFSPEEEAERKKQAKKAQKAEAKAKKAAATSGEKNDPPVPDADPTGIQLLKTETPIDDALKLWRPLERLAAERVETWLSGYEIFIRKKIYLAALKALKSAQSIAPSDPQLQYQILHFQKSTSSAELPESVKAVINSELPSLLTTTPEELSQSLGGNAKSPEEIYYAARGVFEVNGDKQQMKETLLKLGDEGVTPNIKYMEKSVQLLKIISPEDVEEVQKKYRARCPSAWVFTPSTEKETKRRDFEGGLEGFQGERYEEGKK